MNNFDQSAQILRTSPSMPHRRSSNLRLLKFWFVSFFQHMQSISRISMQLLTSPAFRFVAVGMLALPLAQCTGVKKADVVVSVKEQKLGLYEQGQLKKTYDISTSKFGLGDKPGSNCTPLGQHQVVAKIGHGLPAGAVLKSRRWNGEVLKPNAPGRDPIVSRILWLKGTESSNRHAFGRYIYIHGTPEEKNLGKPASYGCVRMGMKDVVNVFNLVNVGAKVLITKGDLPRGEKPKESISEDGSPALDAPDGSNGDDKALPIQIAKLETDPQEKANAEKNEKEKAGPAKPAASKTGSTSTKSRTANKNTGASTQKVTKKDGGASRGGHA
jgi:lipoprotein-anchoring transpeptidase ErfK/SrfK